MAQGKRKSAERSRTQPVPPAGATWGWPTAACVLALVCLAAYWNSFRAGFLLDNQAIVLNDPRLRAVEWHSVREIFTRHYWWPSLESHLFRPLTTLSYWFNYSVLGNAANPFGYHAVNLLLHWLNATLVFALVREVSGRPWAALAAAALFAVHPLTVESVTNIVGRADLFAGLSVLAGVWLYRRFLGAGRGRVMWLTGLGAACLAGVFSKESAVVLPAVMLLHDLAFPIGQKGELRASVRSWMARVWPAYLAVLPGLAALLAARWVLFRDSLLFGQFASDNPIVVAPLWTAVMTGVKVAGYCLALVIWPAKLSCDYSYNAVTLFGWTLSEGQDPHAWAALAVLIGLAVAASVAWRRARAVWFFMGFAAAAYLPTSNLLMAIGTIMAERLMSLPLAAAIPAAALAIAAIGEWAAAKAPARGRRGANAALAVAALAIVAAFAARTMQRNEDWASAERLWSSSARAAPASIKIQRALAALVMESDPSGARAGEAIEIASRGLRVLEAAPLPLPHQPAALFEEIGLYSAAKARLLAARGDAEQARAVLGGAVAMLRRAEEIDRAINQQGKDRLLGLGRSAADVPDNGTPSIYRNLGWACLEAGDAMQAVAVLGYLRRIRPAEYESHYVLGVAEGGASEVERARGNLPAARQHLERAAVSLVEATLLNPGHEPSWETLARVYGLLAPGTEAIRRLDGRPALNLDVAMVEAHFRRACVGLVSQLAAAGLRDEAARWRQRMVSEFGMPRDAFPLE